MKNGRKISELMIIGAGVLWGGMGIYVRHVSAAGLSSMQMAACRLGIACVMMGIALLIYNRNLFKIKLKDIWIFAGSGIVSLTFFTACYFSNILESSMAVASTMLYTAPIFVVLMSAIFFKERITVKKIIAMCLSFVGCLLVTGLIGSGAGISGKGILLGLGSGVGYALYSIFGRFALERKYHSFTITFYTFVFSAVSTCCLVSVSDIGSIIAEAPDKTELILWIIAMAFFTTVAPYILYTGGLNHVENGKASIIASIEPVVASVLGIVVYAERPDLFTIAGILLVLSSIVLLNIKSSK